MHATVRKSPSIALSALGVVVGLGAVLGLGGLALAAQSDSLAMLTGLFKGEWTVKYRDGTADQKVCVKTGEELIQLRHARSDCSRYVVEDSPARVTVQYTCPGEGYGRTDIRRETGALVQIEGQGIARGLPFQFIAEARRTGSC